jgi:hypothetical protein
LPQKLQRSCSFDSVGRASGNSLGLDSAGRLLPRFEA